MEVKGDRRSGVVLRDLMGDPSNGIAGDLDMAKYYAERGRLQQVDATLEGTRTALLRASSYGHIDIVNALLAAGANKDQANERGWTPLNAAAYKGHIECVKSLLAAGANKDQANDEGGWTPLNNAANEGHIECVKSLLAAGANKDQANIHGHTPLDSAAEKGHTEIVAVLEAAAAESQSMDGSSIA